MQSKQLSLSKFTLNKIKFPPFQDSTGAVIVLIGKRGTGKTFLIQEILYTFRDVPRALIISGSEQGNGFYSKHVPRAYIKTEFQTSYLQELLMNQRAILKRNAVPQNKPIDPRVICIMDDMMADDNWIRNTLIKVLFANGRHWRVMFIVSLQYPMGIPPILRTNIDFSFLLRENIVANRKRLYEAYAGMFYTLELFCEIFDQCTNNYECLVIDNTTQSNQLTDQVFWYKAGNTPNFRIGSAEIWERSKRLQEEENDQLEELTDRSMLNRGSKKFVPGVKVRKY